MPHQSNAKHGAHNVKPVESLPVVTLPSTVVSNFPTAPIQQATADDAFVGLKSIAEVGSLFLALSFIGGWSFMTSYYLAFGVNSSDLDFSVPATSAFAVPMLRNEGWPLPLAAVLLTTLVFYYGKLGAARRAWTGVCVAMLVFGVATAGSLRGRRLAAEDIYDTSPRLPNVGFVTKLLALEPDCLSKGTTDCKLLLHTKGAYYFFEPIVAGGLQPVPSKNVRLYIVQDSEISSVQVVRGVE